MEAWHQKNLLEPDFPIQLFITDILEFPPHWHEQIEIIYVLDEELKVGLNNEIFNLAPRDILLVGAGDIHYFMPQIKRSNRLIIQFELSMFESFSTNMLGRRFLTPVIRNSPLQGNKNKLQVHNILESHALGIINEYQNKQEGYKLALKARLYDMIVLLIREIPFEEYSPQQKAKYLNRLERLDNVFRYVEENYCNDISLSEISNIANFSVFHFTRFFKEATGMTFINYLNNFRVSKAAHLLTNTSDPVIEIALKSGFNSIKTFNRVFRELKGCSPTCFKKAKYE